MKLVKTILLFFRCVLIPRRYEEMMTFKCYCCCVYTLYMYSRICRIHYIIFAFNIFFFFFLFFHCRLSLSAMSVVCGVVMVNSVGYFDSRSVQQFYLYSLSFACVRRFHLSVNSVNVLLPLSDFFFLSPSPFVFFFLFRRFNIRAVTLLERMPSLLFVFWFQN